MKEAGWRTKELQEKYKKIAINFVNSLHTNGFLRLSFDQHDRILEKTMIRLTQTGISFGKLDSIITSDRIEDFKKQVKTFDISIENIMLIYAGLFVHIILEEFELLKGLMLMIIKRDVYGYDKKDNPKKIDGNETLGKLLCKINEIVPKNNIGENLNLELRNALGHGKWWIDNQKFCFEGKPPKKKIITYEISQLLLEAIKIKEFTECFYNEGFKRATEIKRENIHTTK